MHYYQFNIADYRKDTTHLTPIEHFIYRSLIDWYYLDEKPIPKRTQSVMRRLGLGSELVDSLKNVLEDFFVLEDEGYTHVRIEQELAKYQARADIARVNGSKGGRPKKPNRKPKKTKSVNLANPDLTQSKANQEPITNNQSNSNRGFHPPTVTEVKSYCSERKNTVDANRFCDFYAAKGWMVGKNKMRDWKAAVRTWEEKQQPQNRMDWE